MTTKPENVFGKSAIAKCINGHSILKSAMAMAMVLSLVVLPLFTAVFCILHQLCIISKSANLSKRLTTFNKIIFTYIRNSKKQKKLPCVMPLVTSSQAQ